MFAVENKNYNLGTTKGKLHHYYSNNQFIQFTVCKEQFITIDDVHRSTRHSVIT
jgi:hypothetical protein